MQNGAVDSFLLSHRNLLVPFASTKMAMANNVAKLDTTNNNINIGARRRHLFVSLFMPKALPKHDQADDERQIGAKNVLYGNHLLLLQSPNDGAIAPQRVHSRRKRLHMLSTLRRVGTPRRTTELLKRLVVEHQQQKQRHVPRKQTLSYDLLWMFKRDF
ncbi:hypothetical protein niasHT_021638 [Heterodera trifolii]|uniref:Uncharacterized protein n=1 Tax=Heterodera trifolii TaxID=157864 RepID=A0ABD2JT63_9BILA